MYFDTYAALYTKYKVLHCSLHVTVINRNASDPLSFVVIPHSEVLTLTSYPLAAEAPYAVKTALVPIACRVSKTLMHQMSTSTILGLKGSQVQDEDYSALVGANPASIWYWNIGAFSQAVNVTTTFQVDLVYDAVFYDRQVSGLSFVKDPELGHVKAPRGYPDPTYNQVTFVQPGPPPLPKAPCPLGN